ncbi:hypothetical protein JCM3766R1_000814 [Sporobolomyces carnicolor]
MKSSLIALGSVLALATSAFAHPEQGMAKVISKRDAQKPNDVEILNFALTLEYLERNFYSDVLKKFSAADFKKAGYSADVRENFQRLAIQEADHVRFLGSALGNAKVQSCKYIFGLSSPKAVVATARLLENVGVAAYSGAAPDIQDKGYLAAAASILTIEARHASYLNNANGASGFPNAYDSALSYDQVYSLAAPLIIPNSCGAGGSLPPGLQAFPALTIVTKTPRSGHKSALKFAEKANYDGDYYGAFIADGTTQYVKIDKATQTINVPKGLEGLVYLVITTAGDSVASDKTVAGPGVMYL